MPLSLGLRAKLSLLILFLVGIAVASQAYFASNLIVGDKKSYLFQENLKALDSLGRSLEERVELANVLGEVIDTNDDPFLRKRYEDRLGSLGINAIYSVKGSAKNLTRLTGKEYPLPELERVLGDFGRDPNTGFVPVRNGEVAFLPAGADGRSRLLVLTLENGLGTGAGTDGPSNAFLLDRTGRAFGRSSPPAFSVEQQREMQRAFADEEIDRSVRVWKVDGTDYVVSVKKLALHSVAVVSLTPYGAVITAARVLVFRSALVGVCIFIICLGVGSFFITSLTSQLRRLRAISSRIAAGDFSQRVPTRDGSRDEVQQLSASFNVMADQVQHLLDERVVKARMEKELETAQAVQRSFFPKADTSGQGYSLAGIVLPSTECAGDWWSYAAVGEELIIFVGDVTGHGVSSALTTATAYGIFHGIFRAGEVGDARLAVEQMFQRLNSAIFDAGRGLNSMSLLALRINPRLGRAWVLNAGHPSPILIPREQRAPGLAPYQNLRVLTGGLGATLGLAPELKVHATEYEIKAGEILALFSDGVTSTAQEARRGKRLFLEALANATKGSGKELHRSCQEVLDGLPGISDPSLAASRDDLTLVLCQIG